MRCPPRRCRSASATTSRTSFNPAATAESATKRVGAAGLDAASSRASVVLPVPGGPQSTSEGREPDSSSERSGAPGATRWRCPTTSSSVRGRIRSASGAPPRARSCGAASGNSSSESPPAMPCSLPSRRTNEPPRANASAPRRKRGWKPDEADARDAFARAASRASEEQTNARLRAAPQARLEARRGGGPDASARAASRASEEKTSARLRAAPQARLETRRSGGRTHPRAQRAERAKSRPAHASAPRRKRGWKPDEAEARTHPRAQRAERAK